MNKLFSKKTGAILFLLNAAVYLTTEFIAAIGTGYPLKDVYLYNFISSLGVYPNDFVKDIPQGFSPLAWVMNFGFIFTGLVFFLAYYLLIFQIVKKDNKAFSYILLLISITFMSGSILVGLFQGGVPSEDGLHGLGARLSFLAGNSTLILSGLAIRDKDLKKYKIISLVLGIFGICSAFGMQNAINNHNQLLMVVFERLTVYPITLWQIITGLIFLRKYKNTNNK
ncbi:MULTISPECIES: DUF998 domain-containing protein [unclassified Gemella]|uniref:DUF998 domain-containing protein n=1 Tax=unclassified Gemella TaxID=2624949 RepID=UPI001C059CE9|nr:MULTISPECIES: DUF998 domain-containing protein [unclassified Gemella]MBU0278995.1 DUF998 domain-containing protein [Gemella sp. zg-1178]QWQ38741.1 DUF998 domain-containing protein [Gemella sp. zg-570]